MVLCARDGRIVYEFGFMVYRGDYSVQRVVVFFFKQKTAYEMLRSLVGSEMCIRDRCMCMSMESRWDRTSSATCGGTSSPTSGRRGSTAPVSYTHLTLPTIYSV